MKMRFQSVADHGPADKASQVKYEIAQERG